MSWRRFYAVLIARNKEFLRDRAALAWNLVFPVLIVIGFAFAFSGSNNDQYKVGVIQQDKHADHEFLRTQYIQFIPVSDYTTAVTKVAGGAGTMGFGLPSAIGAWFAHKS